MVTAQYIDWNLLPRALLGVLALLCGNGYIVGINQIYDVDIDTINKPFLPVAAGEGLAGLPCLHHLKHVAHRQHLWRMLCP